MDKEEVKRDIYKEAVRYIRGYIKENKSYPNTLTTVENVIGVDNEYILSNVEVVSIIRLVNSKFIEYIRRAKEGSLK